MLFKRYCYRNERASHRWEENITNSELVSKIENFPVSTIRQWTTQLKKGKNSGVNISLKMYRWRISTWKEAVKKMQIKTSIHCHYTLTRMAKTTNYPYQVLVRTWNTGTLYTTGGNKYILVCSLSKTVWQFLKNVNICSPFDPAISLLGIHERIWKPKHKDLHTNIQRNLICNAPE